MPIELKNVSYTYMPKTAFEHTALQDVSLKIEDGTFTAVAGHTGSGKSTLVQHFNGILQPISGKVFVDGVDISSRTKEALQAKQSVGLVFQYPEHQLFEETVEMDIAFGPKNLGLTAEEIKKRVVEAMEFVQLDYDTFHERSPFKLSGGQKRRAAIAGVIALRPKYLVLDEPTAGLDPVGREALLQRISRLHKKEKLTIILISHNMDDIARFADRVVVLDKGRIVLDNTPAAVFREREILAKAGLGVPQLIGFLDKLKKRGITINTNNISLDEAADGIIKALKGRKIC